MADEPGQRTPVEYLQHLFGTPQGSPYEPTSEISAGETFYPSLPKDISGTTPYNIPNEAVTRFVESPMGAQARGSINPRNVPTGDVLAGLTNTPTAPPVVGTIPSGPSRAALLPPATKPSPDQENLEIMKKARKLGLLPADFFRLHPDIAERGGGVGAVTGEMDKAAVEEMRSRGFSDAEIAAHADKMRGKMWAWIEPERKTNVEQTMLGVIQQVGNQLRKSLTGPDPTGAIHDIGPILATLMGTAQTATKTPYEIAEIQGRTGVSGATIAETPSKIAEREAHAQALLNPPEHGQDNAMIQLHGHVITTGMKELGEAQRMGDKEGIKYWTEKLTASGKAVDAINQRRNERSSANKRSRWLEEAKARPGNKGLDDATLLAYYDKIYGGK